MVHPSVPLRRAAKGSVGCRGNLANPSTKSAAAFFIAKGLSGALGTWLLLLLKSDHVPAVAGDFRIDEYEQPDAPRTSGSRLSL
jgi:hypothetical protein